MNSSPTIDRASLLPALQKLIKELKDDLQLRLREVPELDERLRADAFEPVRDAGRTAQAFVAWKLDYLEQVAVAWVLACVFVRYMEDNGLIATTYLAGQTADRRRQANDAHSAYLNSRPSDDTDRGYLLDVFRKVGSIPACRDLFAEGKTPLWALGPTGDGARLLLDFWRQVDPETGLLLRPFTVDDGDTRFLGDLYQDLSAEVRKKYALLQTPDFVERFLLDHTLTPALDVFPLAEIRVLDPTCGSGHLVLRAFWRLFHLWEEREPATERTVLVERALAAACGIDINPFAVAITRFRLLLAASQATGVTDLARLPGYAPAVVVGDSLMHGPVFDARGFVQEWLPSNESWSEPIYGLEDPHNLKPLLDRQYHAVVGNPPYITVKDAAAGLKYRDRWKKSCHRQYSLGVPFTERFFNLALAGNGTNPAGFVGMITANSFMKREFGKKLIEEFLPTVELTHVIDTSGAYIPGHGTPTVILFGRNHRPVTPEVQMVLGIKGEPSTPDDPAEGLVWQSILAHVQCGTAALGCPEPAEGGRPTSVFVSAARQARATLGKHPWSIGGGGASDLKLQIEGNGARSLTQNVVSIGFHLMTHADDAFVHQHAFFIRQSLLEYSRPLIGGDAIRDWSGRDDESIVFPYSNAFDQLSEIPESPNWSWLYGLKTVLWNRATFGQGTYKSEGRPWFDYHQFPVDRARVPDSIAFAFIATHNHFVLDRGGKVFKQSAPVIKLPVGATEDDHLALVGLLNSSTACFWMKQTFHNKGSTVDSRGARQTTDPFENFYEFTGTGLGSYPVPEQLNPTLPLARELDTLARRCQELSPAELIKREVPTAAALAANRGETERLQARMVAVQEELDWLCYRLYGLHDEAQDLVGQPPPAVANPTKPKARPFAPEYRRKLPHLQAEGRTLDVTFCTHHRWELPESVRSKVLQHCLHDHGVKLHMHVAIVMPDHVHLLFTPLTDNEGSTFGLAETGRLRDDGLFGKMMA